MIERYFLYIHFSSGKKQKTAAIRDIHIMNNSLPFNKYLPDVLEYVDNFDDSVLDSLRKKVHLMNTLNWREYQFQKLDI